MDQHKKSKSEEKSFTDLENRYYEELKRSEDKFKLLSSVTNDGVIISYQGNILEINDNITKMTGFSRDDLLGKMVFPYIHPDDLNMIIHHIQTGYDKLYEFKCLKKDGSFFYAEAFGKYAFYQGKEVRIAVLRDITSHKNSEARLAKEIEFQKILLEAVPGPVFYKDLDGTYLGCNKSFEKFVGISREKILGKKVSDFLPYDMAQFFKNIDLELITKQGQTSHEYSLNGYNNMNTHIIIHKSLYCDSNGNPQGILGVVSDVTKQKNQEIEYKKAKEYAETILELVPSAIYILDENGVITNWNKAAEHLTKYTKNEILGKTCQQFIIGKCEQNDGTGCRILNKKLDIPLYNLEQKIRTKSGQVRDILKNVAPMKDSNGVTKGAIECFQDVTDKNIAEERIQKYATRLEQSNKELEQFAYVASHDLQEPLRVITSYLRLFLDDFESSLDVNSKKYFDYIFNSAKRMQQMIQDLLQLSRVTSQGKEFLKTDLNGTLARAIENLSLLIKERNVEVLFEKLPQLFIDDGQMTILFQNLINNAIKFNKSKIPKVKIYYEESDSSHIIFVRDNGVGIEQKYWTDIFKLFRRLHSHDEIQGTGIGLSLCQKIIERHHGIITVYQSQKNEGTTFMIKLPKEDVVTNT